MSRPSESQKSSGLYIQLGLICVYQDHRIVRSPPPPAHRVSSPRYQWAAATLSHRGRRAPTTRPTRPPPPSHVELPSPRRPPTHPPALATQAPRPRALALDPPCPPCHRCTVLQDLPATSTATPSQTARATPAPREGLSITRVGSTRATQVIRGTTRKAMWSNRPAIQPATRATSRGEATETTPVLTTTTAQVHQVKGELFIPPHQQAATPHYPPTSAT